jgi:hypothetical protein
MELSQTKKLHTKESGFQKVYPYLLSCGFVLVVYLVVLIMRGIYPFGVNSLASYDLSAQICTFVEHIFDVLKGVAPFSILTRLAAVRICSARLPISS